MLIRLNVETRALHPEADYPWLELMSLDTSRNRYADHLVATYGFEAPVEAALALTPQLGEVIQLRQRARSGLIVEDLLALGLTPARIARLPQCRHIVPFRDPAEALGWMYALERVTLLHDAVRTHVAMRMPALSAWNYLSAYSGIAGQRWQDFGRALDDYAVTPAAADHVVAGARAAFTCQRDWFATDPAQFARQAWDAESSGTRFVRD
jgi:heme oxygenase (biliverdin-IX-beta and delta-forming)